MLKRYTGNTDSRREDYKFRLPYIGDPDIHVHCVPAQQRPFLQLLLMAEAQALADALMAATVNAVALKLPEFSPDRIEYWFIAIEAEFNLRIPAVTQDQTRYSYVVAALKGQVMDRVIDIIRNPPADGKAFKDRLLSAFGRTPLERSKSILDWPGMGDGTPSALLSKMLASLPIGEDPEHILFKALFLRQLPADVQDHLARSTALTTRQLAEHADAYFALSGARQRWSAGEAGMRETSVPVSMRKERPEALSWTYSSRKVVAPATTATGGRRWSFPLAVS